MDVLAVGQALSTHRTMLHKHDPPSGRAARHELGADAFALLARDQACFHALPATAYDACDKQPGRVSSLSLVRHRGTGYSVPTAYGPREVLSRSYVDRVLISCRSEIIARQLRSCERGNLVFNRVRDLALLERKTNALKQAAPLTGWTLPEAQTTLRRLQEAR